MDCLYKKKYLFCKTLKLSDYDIILNKAKVKLGGMINKKNQDKYCKLIYESMKKLGYHKLAEQYKKDNL